MTFPDDPHTNPHAPAVNAGDGLPVAVHGNAGQLSDAGRATLRALSGPRPVRFIAYLLGTWLSIAAAIAVATWAESVWVSLLAVGFVATRQNILGLLVHEQAHYLCSRRRWADAITNLFAAWPLLVLSVERYASVHIAHHRYFYTDRDPDLKRKSGRDWDFPMSKLHFAWLLFTDLIGLNLITTMRGKNATSNIKRTPPLSKGIHVLYLVAAALLLTVTGGWEIFLLYWLLPICTVMQAIVRFGAVCEHKYNVASGKLEECTAIIIPTWWQRVLLPNLNFTYHVYHHLCPGIAFSQLPKVHKLFVSEGLVNESNVYHGYDAYLADLFNPPYTAPVSLKLSER